ncbi:hypothetical protein HF086_005444 [Spodoptera exigua]|uniref:Uncharacterized protein n=1 Tax=Spodoptera exigua TaxID=7107 RepID=A0A922MCG7_SPOEX|nr:hypothetical protein HF086_005444 [Spodoptera exigua]
MHTKCKNRGSSSEQKKERDSGFITPCKQEDTACLKASAQAALPLLAAGVPEMGISVMDPMHVDQVKTVEAGLAMDFRNTYVKGLKNCKVLKLTRHPHRTDLDLKCSVTMDGDYTLGGKLLIMPIEGSGKYTIKIPDAIHEFANQNWQDIFQEVAPPIVKAIVAKIVAETTKLFDHVPIKDLVIQ